MKLEFSGQIFENYSDTNSLENPFSGSRVVPCGQTDRLTKLIVAFRNFANALKIANQLGRQRKTNNELVG